jgi:O-antigen ligase
VLAFAALGWAAIQILPVVPNGWAHPLWSISANIVAKPVGHYISLNRWRTFSELGKLFTYSIAFWLASSLARNESRATFMLHGIVIVSALYALYGFGLRIFGLEQFHFFYSMNLPGASLSGPFVQRNSFATYEGMAALASSVLLVENWQSQIRSSGIRRWLVSACRATFGRGAKWGLTTLLLVSALLGTQSRGGFFATLCGAVSIFVLASLRHKRAGRPRYPYLAGALIIALLVFLFWLTGAGLLSRFIDLVDTGNADAIRVALWKAAERMIASAPFLGLGLGTFPDAYPLYAVKVYPFIMDKAHNDYLEFAAGIGLPAAVCWWCALFAISLRLLRGVLSRRKNWAFPLISFGATILIGVHAAVDFSLQIPAISYTYASLLGLGWAQSFSTRDA